MHTIIRQRRTALGLTQEQVAVRLGVTAPAVNKWEKGVTCPDIALLAPLARLLETDTNTLLCFQEDLTEQEVSDFSRQVVSVLQDKGFAAGFELAQEKLREYPSCGRLLYLLAMTLDGHLLMMGELSGEEKRGYEEQILALYERLAGSGDAELRDSAVYMLASKRMVAEDYEQAQALLDRLPKKPSIDKRQLQANLFLQQGNTEAAAKILEGKCLSQANELQMTLLGLLSLAQKEGDRKAAGAVAGISVSLAELLGLWDYWRYVAPLEEAVDRKDRAACLAAMEGLLEELFRPWEMERSPLYRHILPKKPGMAATGERMLPGLLSELETSPKYAFLREEPEFQGLLKRYRGKLVSPEG